MPASDEHDRQMRGPSPAGTRVEARERRRDDRRGRRTANQPSCEDQVEPDRRRPRSSAATRRAGAAIWRRRRFVCTFVVCGHGRRRARSTRSRSPASGGSTSRCRPEHIGGAYANFANVSFSQYEFTLTFARIEHEIEEGDVPGAVVARVNASPRFIAGADRGAPGLLVEVRRRARGSATCPRRLATPTNVRGR